MSLKGSMATLDHTQELQRLSFLSDRRRRKRSSDGHNCTTGWISGGTSARHHFLLDGLHEILNLPLHFFHALAHLQDDGNAADVYAQIACQIQNELQALQIFVRVESRVAFIA